MLVQILMTLLVLYIASRFVGLAQWVGRQGHHPAWVVLEWVTALLCLTLLLPIWL